MAAIKLSQYLNNPTKTHYQVARTLANYLAATITEAIHYLRDEPVDSLPIGDMPTLHPDQPYHPSRIEPQWPPPLKGPLL